MANRTDAVLAHKYLRRTPQSVIPPTQIKLTLDVFTTNCLTNDYARYQVTAAMYTKSGLLNEYREIGTDIFYSPNMVSLW
jgi:hypothetical protein